MNLQQIRTTGTSGARLRPPVTAEIFHPVAATQASAGVEGNLYFESQGNVALFPAQVKDRVASEFKTHERKWKKQTLHVSSPVDKYLHPSYARIIGLGWPAVAFILKSLKKEPADWFYALRAITGANPVTNPMAGDMRRMTDTWLKWGEARGLV
jgi:hypothetical protein